MATSKFNPNINIRGSKGFTIEVSGFSEVMRNLELTKNQTDRLYKFLKDEAEKVKAAAIALVPVDKGRLKESHRVEAARGSNKDEMRVDVVAGGIHVQGRFVDYAAAVHEGYREFVFGRPTGRNVPGRPWLANAIRAHTPGYMNRLKRAIKIHGR